jgi:hypothetical protein
MQVVILEYVIPRVLEYPCVKFVRVSMSKTWLINILPSGSVLTGHIRTRPDMFGLLGLFHSVECRLLMGSSYDFYILFLALMPYSHSCSLFFLEGNDLWWRASFEASSGCWCFLKWSLCQAQETCQETKTQQLSGGVLPWGLSTSWWYSRWDRLLKDVSSDDPHQSWDHELQLGGSHECDAYLQQALL